MRTSLAVTLLIAACGGTKSPPSTPSEPGAALATHDLRSPGPAGTAVDDRATPGAPSRAPTDGGAAPSTAEGAATDGGAAPTAAARASSTMASSSAAPLKVGTRRDRAFVDQLTVTVHGAGAVRGGVRSVPAGIDCILPDTAPAGRSSKTCHATFRVGDTITLQFVPGGAGHLAQFHDGTRVICNGQACTFELAGAAAIAVYPISVPPPPGPARAP